MPIKPENKSLYPDNWDEISEEIRFKRANNKCEVCGVPNHAVGYRKQNGLFVPVCGNIFLDLAGQGLSYQSLEMLSYLEARQISETLNGFEDNNHYIVIVLTTAHLDHDPTNNDYNNLKAMCQHCHNNYDLPHRLETKKQAKLVGQMAIQWPSVNE